jgi:hypothetical protein
MNDNIRSEQFCCGFQAKPLMAAWPRKQLSGETTFHLDDKATITTLAYTVVKIITKSSRVKNVPQI